MMDDDTDATPSVVSTIFGAAWQAAPKIVDTTLGVASSFLSKTLL